MNKSFSYIEPDPYLVQKDASIYEAMLIIEKGEERICFIVDKNKKLIKVISDGDIRRSLLKKLNLNEKVVNIHKNKPRVIHEEQMYEGRKNSQQENLVAL